MPHSHVSVPLLSTAHLSLRFKFFSFRVDSYFVSYVMQKMFLQIAQVIDDPQDDDDDFDLQKCQRLLADQDTDDAL